MNELGKFDKAVEAQIDADVIKSRNDATRRAAVNDPEALIEVIKNEEDMAIEDRLAAEIAADRDRIYRR